MPAVRFIGAGPKELPSTEYVKGAVPQDTFETEKDPSDVPTQFSFITESSTFTSVMLTSNSTGALSVHHLPFELLKAIASC